jgi:hypothetical protein
LVLNDLAIDDRLDDVTDTGLLLEKILAGLEL